MSEPSGVGVYGTVRTRDLQAFTPTVAVVPVGAPVPESCARGIAALGAWQARVDSHGRHELGPLSSGRWRLLFRAPYHKEAGEEIAVVAEDWAI